MGDTFHNPSLFCIFDTVGKGCLPFCSQLADATVRALYSTVRSHSDFLSLLYFQSVQFLSMASWNPHSLIHLFYTEFFGGGTSCHGSCRNAV